MTSGLVPGPVLVTGATGFVGRALVRSLARAGIPVRAALRRPGPMPEGAAEAVVLGELSGATDARAALKGMDAVVHAAAIAHTDGISEDAYAAANRDGTLALARQATDMGLRRFVFLSSVRAQTGPVADHVLTEADPAAPTDAYGRSKWEAERGLAGLDVDWVALRPVLVVGPGVKANMAALKRLAALPVPLPVKGFSAKRSLVSLDGVVEAVRLALALPAGQRRPYLVADPEPLSIAQIVAELRAGAGRSPGLFAVAPAWLEAAAGLAGRRDALARLAGGLVVDPAALVSAGWRPPPVREALRALGARPPSHPPDGPARSAPPGA